MGKHASGPVRIAVAVLLACVALWAHAAGGNTFSVFDSADLNRQIHGHRSAVDLSAGPMRLGRASSFFGVDSLSDKATHYLTSGLEWHSADAGRSLLTVGAMHTAARGADVASQTLMRAETHLDLGSRWYLPDLTLEADQLSSNGDPGAALGGRATRFGFAHDFDGGAYRLTYFRADADYHPWGSALIAGDRGVELTGRYDLGSRWRLRNTLRVHHSDIPTSNRRGVVDEWRLSGVDAPTDIGRPWRLTAQLGDIGMAADSHSTPLELQLASRTHRWRNWHIDSTLGWYQDSHDTPGGMPIDGGLWQVSASRNVSLGGWQARLTPSFSIGGSRYDNSAYGSRTGLAMGLPGLLDNVALSVNYLSPGWSPIAKRADMRLALHVSQSTGAVVPRLGSLVDRLRGSWFAR